MKRICLILTVAAALSACKKNHDNPSEESHIGYNADSEVLPYDGYFRYGSNMGYYPGWDDAQLAELLIGSKEHGLSGAGVNSLRPAMYDYFVEQWGFSVRVETFKKYQALGGRDHTIFLNGVDEKHRDKTKYCDAQESLIFDNLYEPIWTADSAINENNYFARYVYNVVKNYSPWVRFWEVWNEPDYTWNWEASQTWDKVNPDPADLPNLYAPIQRYVRMLRITYEVVKSIDPDAYICVGGLGYPGFLDAVLRNSDAPDGVVTDESPAGGAWFDCVSYHCYPMYYLTEGKRNSDAAVQAVIDLHDEFDAVLKKYGYDGSRHPAKEWIITECNIPRKSFDGYIGSDEAQRNFLIKVAVKCQQADIRGLYVYGAADSETYDAATDPYHLTGLFQKMPSTPYHATPNSAATAWRTVSTLLRERRYNDEATRALNLPPDVDGGAFYSENERNNVYVLWSKPTADNENGNVIYTFPAAVNVKGAKVYTWEQKESSLNDNQITLTGSPVFVR